MVYYWVCHIIWVLFGSVWEYAATNLYIYIYIIDGWLSCSPATKPFCGLSHFQTNFQTSYQVGYIIYRYISHEYPTISLFLMDLDGNTQNFHGWFLSIRSPWAFTPTIWSRLRLWIEALTSREMLNGVPPQESCCRRRMSWMIEGMRKLKISKNSGEIDMIHIEQSHRNPTWFYLFWAAQGIRKLGSGWSLGAKTYDIPVFFVGVLPSCQACQNPMWSDQGLVGTPWANNEWFGPVVILQHLPSKRQWNPKIQGPAVGLQSARFPGGTVGGRFLWFRVVERLHFTLQPRAAVYVHCTWTSWMWFG